MKDPVRLLDGGATQAELVLLRAGAAEEPPDAARLRLAAALGLSAAVLAPAASAGAETGGGATLGGVSGKLGLIWLAAVGGSVALGVAVMLYRGAEPDARSAAPVEAPPAAEPTEPAAPTPSSAPTLSKIEAPQQAQAPQSRTRPASRSIAREIERLDLVRGLLARGEPRAALAALDRYGAQHPSGVLRQEATLLRIEALARAGDQPGARRLAERFLRENPASPHGRRIRALFGDAADGP